MNNNIFRLASTALVFALAACGGGGSSSAPTAPTSSSPPSGPLSSAIVLVTNPSVTVEPTATGVIYRSTLTLSEVSFRSGATIASIRVNLSNSSRNGSATFNSSDNIVTALASGGSNVYLLNVTSDNRDAFTQVTFTVTYTDNAGVGGSFTSPTASSITPVPAAFTPPGLGPPAPTADAKFNGTYDFWIRYPTSATLESFQNIRRLVTIRNGIISSADGLMSGTVNNLGFTTFTWPCIITPNSLADFRGNFNPSALSGSNFGEGTYTCRMPITISPGVSWRAQESR